MKLVFIGDIMGRTGRDALAARLPEIKSALSPDVIIVNGENAAHGVGISEKICRDFYELGVDCITTGNHVWDQREIIPYIDRDPNLLRPLNFPQGTPGRGIWEKTLADGRRIMVMNAMGRLFMDPLDDPFAGIAKTIEGKRMGRGGSYNAIFLDFHAEASSEKMAMGQYLDGKVSGVVGTHTHIPTADLQILPGGTAYQTDAGMTGDFDSVIGVRKDISIHRFTRKTPGERMIPADGEATVCGVFIETDDATGLARRAEPLRIGGRLRTHMPSP